MARLLKSVKENFFFWGIGFLLFFIPVYPKFPLFEVSETYVHVRLEDLFVAIIVGLFFLRLFLKRDFSFFKDTLSQLIGLFFAVGFISIVSALFITKNIVPHLALLHFLRRIEYISLLFVAYGSFKNLKQLKTYGWALLVATFGVIVYGLGQKYFSWPVVSTMNKEFSQGMLLKLTWWARINSTFAGHYDLAAFMVMILPLSIIAFIIAKKWISKILVFLLTILSYYILILTASRVSFIAYLVGVSLVLWVARQKIWLIPFLALSILGMVLSGDLGQRYAATFKIDLSFLSGVVIFQPRLLAQKPTVIPTPTLPAVLVTPLPTKPRAPTPTSTPTPTPTPTPLPIATASAELFEPTALATSRSTDIRLKVEWPRAIRAFAKNPLLGTGYSSITLATDNDYFRSLGEVGLLGTLAFMAIILEISRRIYFFLMSNLSTREERLIVLAIAGAGIGYFLNAIFIDVLESSKIAFFFWILIGIALKVIDLSQAKKGNMTNL